MMTMYVSPYRRLAHLRNAMDRLIDENMIAAESEEREMLLAVDVIAQEDNFEIRALVPGLDADALNIEILNNTVTLRGEFKSLATEDAKFLVSELPAGRFARVVTLPVAVDASKAEATIKDGVLALRVPKAEAYRPKTIKINVN
jgi:HSP20 family protein